MTRWSIVRLCYGDAFEDAPATLETHLKAGWEPFAATVEEGIPRVWLRKQERTPRSASSAHHRDARIMVILREQTGPVTLRELATLTGFNAVTVERGVRSLLEARAIIEDESDPQGWRYAVSP